MPRNHSCHSSRHLKFQQLEARCVLDASGLRISEFMASNDDTLQDFEGDSSDWIELFNPLASEVSLAGLYLTDDSDELTQWQFPSGAAIDAGGYLVVFASGKDVVAPNGEYHTSFRLSADGEYLGLVDVDGQSVIDAFSPEFPAQEKDVSYGLTMSSSPNTLVAEGAIARAWVPTSGVHDAVWTSLGFNDNVFNIQGPTGFGYEDSFNPWPTFVGEYNTAVPNGTSSLYVRTPFTVDSTTGVTQLTLRMKYDDGFVAYLNGVQIAAANAPNATRWNSTATSSHDDFDAISFQDFDVSSAIPLLISGDNVLAIHALNRSSGSSDFLVAPELITSQAAIVAPDAYNYFDAPTPGFGNGDGFAGFAAAAEFNVPHGFYDSPQLVQLSSATAGSQIVYTTDGSTPAVDANLNPVNGSVYSGPIVVTGTTTIRATTFKQDYRPSFVQAASYLFLDDVVDQSPAGQAPSGWPGYNVNGQFLDYGVDPAILSLYGEQAVKDSLAAIPSLTLTTDVENLFDPATGIYVNALNRGFDWERLASVELINPDGSEGFSTNAGLRIRGGAGRNDYNPKHAFRLYFRGDYGDGLLDYPLFGEDGADEFDVLDLRTASNYSWAAWGDSVNGQQNTYLREVFSRDTQADMGHPTTRSNYYHLYLNGQYWGLYQTQERVQEQFAEAYFGGDESDYDVLKADSTEAYTFEISDGNDVAWRQLFDLAQDLDDNPTANADNFWAMQGLTPEGVRDEQLEVLLDVDNLVDYMMIIIYTGGHDTGISAFLGNDRANNWFSIRNRETADQGFQFFLHDNEHSLGSGELTGTLHGTFDIDRTGPFRNALDDNYDFFNPVYLHQDLLSHPAYVQRIIDRVQELMFDDGVLTPDANIARMAERADQVAGAIIAEAARWGDAKRFTPYNKTDWDNEVEWLLDVYFPARHDMVLGQLLQDGLYLPAPTPSQPSGAVPYGLSITLANGVRGGTVYYTTDGQDPRGANGGINQSANVLSGSGPIVLVEDTVVFSRTLAASGYWTGLVQASYTVDSRPGDYDDNGLVEQADYDLWRSTYGSTSDLRADGNHDQVVNAADYAIWRDALAQPAASPADSAEANFVEPAAAAPSEPLAARAPVDASNEPILHAYGEPTAEFASAAATPFFRFWSLPATPFASVPHAKKSPGVAAMATGDRLVSGEARLDAAHAERLLARGHVARSLSRSIVADESLPNEPGATEDHSPSARNTMVASVDQAFASLGGNAAHVPRRRLTGEG
ncbi:CotH protein [Posidoniimonas polymericola]|uniref:CotH protein n=1 Tax=Posidoniimonas polymericola TaxID=2528002 RepID=A0A5C5ZEN7_9BACT|nr:CotH kinase family protein [Posidoniimonas polymericola]TWT85899.1 CotH protein [Posidoniimonas polymericola]